VSGHDLVVGGSGMLSGLVTALARKGRHVSVIARDPRRLARLVEAAGGVTPLPFDYRDAETLETALLGTRRANGPIERAVCWFHTAAPAIPLAVARHVERIYCHVLGSAAADPATPAVLRSLARRLRGLPQARLQARRPWLRPRAERRIPLANP
jgi:NAD(P)-dependent dehydrogenase (short-subunit alcohol dehydrogenase family)